MYYTKKSILFYPILIFKYADSGIQFDNKQQ